MAASTTSAVYPAGDSPELYARAESLSATLRLPLVPSAAVSGAGQYDLLLAVTQERLELREGREGSGAPLGRGKSGPVYAEFLTGHLGCC